MGNGSIEKTVPQGVNGERARCSPRGARPVNLQYMVTVHDLRLVYVPEMDLWNSTIGLQL
jgi:hypothetical protein